MGEKTISRVKKLSLSKGRRLIVMKSTLLFLPIFCYCFWCLFKWLISWGNFKGTFYGEDWGCQKVPFGGLESSIFPIKEGGLSIKKLSYFNQALLGWWLWRFEVENDHLWRRVIYVKYGESWGGWTTKPLGST